MTERALTKSQRLCAFDAVPDGGALELAAQVEGDAVSLLLLRRGDAVRAFHNVCPHAGRRLDWAPGRFLFEQGLLVCAAHGAMFSVPDGVCVSGPCRGQSLGEVPLRRDADGVHLAQGDA